VGRADFATGLADEVARAAAVARDGEGAAAAVAEGAGAGAVADTEGAEADGVDETELDELPTPAADATGALTAAAEPTGADWLVAVQAAVTSTGASSSMAAQAFSRPVMPLRCCSCTGVIFADRTRFDPLPRWSVLLGVGALQMRLSQRVRCRCRASAVSPSRQVRVGRSSAVYAIVRSGGRQHKVAVGDVVEVDRVEGEPGTSLTLAALLLVDGDAVTSDAKALGNVKVTAEVVDHTKGPKIHILKYKNKTGYRKRQGHRQRHSRLKVTGIETGK
jgi:large subunit ribosomal protein L21